MPTMPETAFEDHRARVYAWAYRLVQNHHDALDVTQEVLIRWWRTHAVQDAPSNAVGWLRRVTVNLAIDTIRSAARRPERRGGEPVPLADTEALAASDHSVRREAARQVAEALESLSEHQRGVVVAKVYDGCTFARIAEQMGLAVPTVKTHYLRGLEALRRKLPPPDEPLGAARSEHRPSGPAARNTGASGDHHGL